MIEEIEFVESEIKILEDINVEEGVSLDSFEGYECDPPSSFLDSLFGF